MGCLNSNVNSQKAFFLLENFGNFSACGHAVSALQPSGLGLSSWGYFQRDLNPHKQNDRKQDRGFEHEINAGKRWKGETDHRSSSGYSSC